MRVFIAVLVLIFSLQSWTKADDIRDFEIEGMSIEDSLLDHFSKEEIKEMSRTEYPGTDKYIQLGYNSTTKFKVFEAMSFHVKKNDKNFIIHSFSGGIYYESDFNECIDKKKDLVRDLKLMFKNTKYEEYDFKYEVDDGKSIAYINAFAFNNNDKIRAWCVNWSEVTEKKRNFVDNLSLSISPNYFLEWLNNEAKQ